MIRRSFVYIRFLDFFEVASFVCSSSMLQTKVQKLYFIVNIIIVVVVVVVAY